MEDDRICLLFFMEFMSLCGDDIMWLLEKNGLVFLFICKIRVVYGINFYEMVIVFNQEGLNVIQFFCVVQNFINYNVVLYKVFVVGEFYIVVQRFLFKNFFVGILDCEFIFFNSYNVLKLELLLVLMELDKIEGVFEWLSDEVIWEFFWVLWQVLGVLFFGIDIIINNQIGQYVVVDINVFLGYEGVSEFFIDFLNYIVIVLQGQSIVMVVIGDVVLLRYSKFLVELVGGLMGEWICSVSFGCCGSMMGQDVFWKVEVDVGGIVKLLYQRFGCNIGMLFSFQQYCVVFLVIKVFFQQLWSWDLEGWCGVQSMFVGLVVFNGDVIIKIFQ